VRVAEASALTAGLIGGVGGASCRTLPRTPSHNGLTQLSACTTTVVHGAKSRLWCVWSSLRLKNFLSENRFGRPGAPSVDQPVPQIKLPVCPKPGLSRVSLEELQQVCAFACSPAIPIYTTFLCGQPHGSVGCPVSTTEAASGRPSHHATSIAQAERSQLEATRTGPDA